MFTPTVLSLPVLLPTVVVKISPQTRGGGDRWWTERQTANVCHMYMCVREDIRACSSMCVFLCAVMNAQWPLEIIPSMVITQSE